MKLRGIDDLIINQLDFVFILNHTEFMCYRLSFRTVLYKHSMEIRLLITE